jgi:predicted RNA-binding Zn-ribbon protein involved in translation (DUF1610 family)
MIEHRFLNKVDFSVHPSLVPNNNEGNLKLYRLFSLIRDSFELKSLDDAVGFPDTLEAHLIYYKNLVDTMAVRGLSVPRSDKNAIEKMLSASMKVEKITEPITVYHCPKCGSKLTKLDVESYKCGECHGRLPGYSEHILAK